MVAWLAFLTDDFSVVGRQKSMWSQAARSYTWCKPLRTGRETTLPSAWRGLGAGVSSVSERGVDLIAGIVRCGLVVDLPVVSIGCDKSVP